MPGISEIYPIDDLEWENTSVANNIRAEILNLPNLSNEQCAEVLETLNELGVDDQRTVASFIGLAPDAGSLWEDMRIGELKTLLALAADDADATIEGCDWVRQFAQLDEKRKLVYRCIETLLNLDDSTPYRVALTSLYGAETLQQARALLKGELRFFGLHAPGMEMKGCNMHQRLLAAYGKLHKFE